MTHRHSSWIRLAANVIKEGEGVVDPLAASTKLLNIANDLDKEADLLAQSQWVSVKDRLPDTTGYVTVSYIYGERVAVEYYSDLGSHFHPGVTHWTSAGTPPTKDTR